MQYHDPAILPPEVFASLAGQYKEFYRVPYEAVFRYLNIDLVVWDRQNNLAISYESIPELEKVIEIGKDFVIYKVN